jgi:hypothetical protein
MGDIFDETKLQVEMSINELGMVLMELWEDLSYMHDDPEERDETYDLMIKLQKVHDDAVNTIQGIDNPT